MTDRYDVVISGAGVAGLTTAALLDRQGLRVLVLDKSPKASTVHKGEVLQPRSLQVLDGLGALAALRRRGALTTDRLVCRRRDGRGVVELDYSLLPDPDNRIMLHYYGAIGQSLMDASPGVELRRDAVVTAPLVNDRGRVHGVLVRSGGRVTPVRAALTVSCEGTGSALRKALGCDVPRVHYPHRLLAFDLDDPGTVPTELTAFLTARGLRLLYPMPGGRARLYVQIRPDEYRSTGRAGLPAWSRALLRDTPALGFIAESLVRSAHTVQPLGASRYLADRWWVPGFAMVGDAAHAVHPMAAQGMNAAIADAWQLARELERVGSVGAADIDAALAAYAATRRRAMEYVGRLSHNLATVFTDTGWRTRALYELMLRRNASNLRLASMIVYNMSGLGIRRFTHKDRLHQFGLPDRRRRQPWRPTPADAALTPARS